MPFCSSCGRETGGAAFCPGCGASQSATVSGSGTAAATPTAGLEENVAGLLCYLFGWISGLVFLLIDKRPFVRFHGAQAIGLNIGIIVCLIAYSILSFVMGVVTTLLHFPVGWLLFFLLPLVGIGFFATWIYCMVKAYQHEKFKLPIIGDMVEKMLG